MNLIVKNRHQAETENSIEEPHLIISFYSPHRAEKTHRGPARVCKLPSTLEVVRICCDDLSHAPREGGATANMLDVAVLFSMSNAMDIANHIFELKPETVMCHCDAGQSRSAGAAAAIEKFFEGDDSHWYPSGTPYGPPEYTPNSLVYRLTLEALHTVQRWRNPNESRPNQWG